MKTTKDLSNYDIYECDKCQRSPTAVFVLSLLSKDIPTKKLLFLLWVRSLTLLYHYKNIK